MDWSKQAETMVHTWSEAQRKMWESWFDLAKLSPGNNETPFAFYSNMLKQWQEMTNSGVQNWMGGADPYAKNLAKQVMMSQEAMMSFMHTLAQVWKTIGPKLDAGEDWQSVLKEYSDKWVNSVMNMPASVITANTDINQLWKLYTEEWQNLGKFWTQSFAEPPKSFGDLSSMFGGGSMLLGLSSLQWDTYEKISSSFTDLPGLGNNREFNVKLMKSFDTWVDLQRTGAEYQKVVAKTYAQAFEKFIQLLIDKGEKGEVIDSIRDLMNLWFETVDQTFVHMYVSEDYLEVQRELAAAAMTHKMRQQEILETFMKAFDLPTRSELDDAYKSLHDLRQEMKALKKEVKALREAAGAAAPAEPATKKAPSRSRASRSKAAPASDPNGKSPEPNADTVAEEQPERS